MRQKRQQFNATLIIEFLLIHDYLSD